MHKCDCCWCIRTTWCFCIQFTKIFVVWICCVCVPGVIHYLEIRGITLYYAQENWADGCWLPCSSHRGLSRPASLPDLDILMAQCTHTQRTCLQAPLCCTRGNVAWLGESLKVLTQAGAILSALSHKHTNICEGWSGCLLCRTVTQVKGAQVFLLLHCAAYSGSTSSPLFGGVQCVKIVWDFAAYSAWDEKAQGWGW